MANSKELTATQKDYLNALELVIGQYKEFLGQYESWFDGQSIASAVADKAEIFIEVVSKYCLLNYNIFLPFPVIHPGSNGTITIEYKEEVEGPVQGTGKHRLMYFMLNVENDDVVYNGVDEFENAMYGKLDLNNLRVAPLLFWRI